MFEPIGVAAGESFETGRAYDFRASFRGELPSWYGGRRRRRTTSLRGEGVRVIVTPLHAAEPETYDLVPASGNDAGHDDDFYCIVPLTMPDQPSRLKLFVQFARDEQELRSTVITLDVTKRVQDARGEEEPTR